MRAVYRLTLVVAWLLSLTLNVGLIESQALFFRVLLLCASGYRPSFKLQASRLIIIFVMMILVSQ